MPEARIELLAPAGDMDALRAAVQNGADAVYLGSGRFNARRNAENFDGDGLRLAVIYCHTRGVKVHVTLNTLVRQDEFDALEAEIAQVYKSGADAVIVQDLGVARAVRQIAPDLELHASTQLAVHNRQGAAFLKARGFDRAVLARELTYEEMARCAAEGIEIETFVHGALCVACSGQCLMSSMVGGRSGNRGLCAQPCRLPWRYDGREGYLLSTKDLCAIDDLARLRDAGVASLKIEGRMKRAEYVAVTAAAYRRALDALERGLPYDSEADRRELRQMFNRGGFTRGYGPGVRETELMYPQRPNHVGVQVGACRKKGELALSEAVSGGDALALRSGEAGEDFPVKASGVAGDVIRCRSALPGDGLWRLVSEEQLKRARDSFDGERRRVSVTAHAVLRTGQPAILEVDDGLRRERVEGRVVEEATERGFDRERAAAQLNKTGGTPFEIVDLTIEADARAHCPASMLNALRRDALDALAHARWNVARRPGPLEPAHPEGRLPAKPLLMAQSADPDQLEAALALGADAAVYAPEDMRPEALAGIDLSGLLQTGRLGLAVPGVLDDRALEGLNAWALGKPFVYTFLSNVGQLGLNWPGLRMGDALLNIGNNAAAAQLTDWGLSGYTPSIELNAGQLALLEGQTNLIVWGRVPLMHLRHCPLRSAEGMKGRHADCRHCDGGAPGRRLGDGSLVDRKGVAFPLNRLAMPGGCVIQVLNSVPLMPLKRLERLPRCGGWRLLLRGDEPTEAIVKVYRAALDGEDFKALPQWEIIEGMQTTTGHYFRGVE